MKKLGIYVRQSRDKETTLSIEDQIKSGQEMADSLNLEYELYIDKGISAFRDTLDNRPEILRLFNDIQNDKVGSVFCIDETRLIRTASSKVIAKKLFKEKGIIVYTTFDGTIDYSDPQHVFMSDIKTVCAEKSIHDSRGKVRAVLMNRARAGQASGGILPFGYKSVDKMLVIDEEEATVVQEIFQLSMSGVGSGTIAKILNERSIPTKGRKSFTNGITRKNKYTNEYFHISHLAFTWVGNTVLGILKNPTYKGERLFKGVTVTSPKIISTDIWDAVQNQIKQNTHRPGSKHKYLLRGLCFCGRCGNVFSGRTRQTKRDHIYFCTSRLGKKERCGIRSINIDYLDEIVWYAVSNSNTISSIALEEVKKLKDGSQISKLMNQRSSYEHQLGIEKKAKNQIQKMVIRDLMTVDEAEEEIKECDGKIRTYTEELESIVFQINEYNSIEKCINEMEEFRNQLSKLSDSASYETKRALINLYIGKVTINFDDETETFSIDLLVNIDKQKDTHTFFLQKGSVPNLINYKPEKDKFLLDMLKRTPRTELFPMPHSVIESPPKSCDVENEKV